MAMSAWPLRLNAPVLLSDGDKNVAGAAATCNTFPSTCRPPARTPIECSSTGKEGHRLEELSPISSRPAWTDPDADVHRHVAARVRRAAELPHRDRERARPGSGDPRDRREAERRSRLPAPSRGAEDVRFPLAVRVGEGAARTAVVQRRRVAAAARHSRLDRSREVALRPRGRRRHAGQDRQPRPPRQTSRPRHTPTSTPRSAPR